MKPERRRENLLFILFLAFSAALVVVGVLKEQMPETLFNATLI